MIPAAFFHPYVVTGLITSVVTIGVGIFVYLKNRRSHIHRSFLIFSAAISEWSFFTALQAVPENSSLSFLLSKTCHIGAALLPVFFYYFTLKLIGKENKRNLKTGFCIAFVLILAILFSPLFSEGTRQDVGLPNFYRAGPLYFLFIIFFLTYVLLGILHLWKEIRISSGARKKHIEYFFYASIVGFAIGIFNFFPVYGRMIPPFPYSAACGALYSCVIAYAILKHKLFEIELIVKKGITFGVLFSAVYGACSVFLFFASSLLAGHAPGAVSAVSIALAMLLYEPLKGLLTQLTNRFLFQKKIPYGALIQSLTDRLSRIHKAEGMAAEIVDFLTGQMALEWAGLYLKASDGASYKHISGNAAPLAEAPASFGIALFAALLSRPYVLSPFDVEGSGAFDHKGELRSRKIEALVPIKIEGQLEGFILLGKKKSDDAFSPDEEALLQALMEEAGMFFLAAKLLNDLGRANLEVGHRIKMSAVTKLARGVHHEVRNPLHAMDLFACAMLERLKRLEYHSVPDQTLKKDALERAKLMSEQIDRIKNSLGRFASFAYPEMQATVMRLRLAREIQKFLDLMREAQTLDSIKVHVSVPEEIGVEASEGILQEILFNLFNNAAEAMRGKGELFIEASQDGALVRLIFRDTGPGIAAEILPKIFDSYFTTKTGTEAVGIGLAIVKHHMESLGGRVAATQSQGLGRGAELILHFPHAQEEIKAA